MTPQNIIFPPLNRDYQWFFSELENIENIESKITSIAKEKLQKGLEFIYPTRKIHAHQITHLQTKKIVFNNSSLYCPSSDGEFSVASIVYIPGYKIKFCYEFENSKTEYHIHTDEKKFLCKEMLVTGYPTNVFLLAIEKFAQEIKQSISTFIHKPIEYRQTMKRIPEQEIEEKKKNALPNEPTYIKETCYYFVFKHENKKYVYYFNEEGKLRDSYKENIDK